MDIGKHIVEIDEKGFSVISKVELEEFSAEAELLEEVDTRMRDFIRLFSMNGKLFIQEMTDKSEYVLRSVESREDAKKFIKDRLALYSQMWDGCGVNIDYYEK